MKYSPLKLEGLHFTDVRISSQPNANPGDVQSLDVSVETDSEQVSPGNSRIWCVVVRVRINERQGAIAPYYGEVEAIGSFSVDASWAEDQMDSLVYINGSGLVYAAIREMICSITARGFFDMLVLPSCSFGQMYKELQESKKKRPDPGAHAENPLGRTVSPPSPSRA
jgi:preprotein translocase subunit SecB